eukprot:scaffold34.g4503.t1
MNAVTVQQTAQGLCAYLEAQPHEAALLRAAGVTIGYDGRHHSREFALIAAAVFASRGYTAHLFGELVPTPFVPAAVTQLGCAAGVMITASHNPKEYNGVKVYWSNGCQARVLRVADAYYAALTASLHFRSVNADAPRMAYTALHGVGTPWVERAFAAFGLPPPVLTPSQCGPDPDFSTGETAMPLCGVTFPNPEEGEGAWAAAFEAAEAAGAVLAIATDPDADRFAVAERSPDSGRWRTFSGNEIGVMLGHWVLINFLKTHNDVPEDRLALLSSTVSSRMLEQARGEQGRERGRLSVAKQEGVLWAETLTGFKWLGNKALELEAAGYTVGKDKDGVAAAAVFGELAAEELFGVFETRQSYFVADPPAKAATVFARLREHYPATIGGMQVIGVRDMGAGVDTSQPDGRPALPWQPSDLMTTFTLEGPATLTLRASGTEPKLKYYAEVSCGSREDCRRRADALESAVAEELVRPADHGLALPPGHHTSDRTPPAAYAMAPRRAALLLALLGIASLCAAAGPRKLLQDSFASATATAIASGNSQAFASAAAQAQSAGQGNAVSQATATAIAQGQGQAVANAAAQASASGGASAQAAASAFSQGLADALCKPNNALSSAQAVASALAQAQGNQAFASATTQALASACQRCPFQLATSLAFASASAFAQALGGPSGTSQALANALASADAGGKLAPQCVPATLAMANAQAFAQATGGASLAQADAAASANAQGSGGAAMAQAAALGSSDK